MKTLNKALQAKITPKQALELLKAGNTRFVDNLRINRNLLQMVNETSDGQWPMAAIVSCMDSRTSAELIFDQGLGDIFSIRLAGAVVSDNVLGSLEYACKVAGSKFIVVLGHTKCGAIKGACDAVELGNLTALLNKIAPAVFAEKTITGNRNSHNGAFVEAVNNIHVERSVQAIVEQSNILRDMLQKGEIGIIGAIYDVETGVVSFMDHTLILEEKKEAVEAIAG
ncbi:carbonic anhydrase [Chitinophaga terrae (ex Kim and Jung 2007)]|uniref:Carbonic anhydrase n=1 Tax=Chitinophaga terrae (ex Kim and Jung 2007) TaxID=408074 RepID=A0A1H4EB63_9BACT|nr:carbonic anhydrase family protein [Chitinophaga terrae (ex Kim and Jung 2007)]GEP91510.1 carbonic anhydrase [Chitinophaga terrae (ex Kim and Jung 2007)]SEA82039.1 carbonic anhydrase [Chitinophaga terrae (ex Kim and Jung 2007)]